MTGGGETVVAVYKEGEVEEEEEARSLAHRTTSHGG